MSEFLPPPEPEPQPRAPFRLPADYYSAPVSEVRPVFDKWVPFGCGTAAILFVLVLFAGGVFAGRGGMEMLFDTVFSMMQKELTEAFAADVNPQERTAFDAEYTKFRTNVRDNHIELTKVQTFLKSVTEAEEDKKLTGDEVRRLTTELHALNAGAK